MSNICNLLLPLVCLPFIRPSIIVSVGNTTLRRDYLHIAPSKKIISGPNTTCFRWLPDSTATLRANISGDKSDIENREMPLETTKGFLGPLTAKNRTVIFTHPLKSSSAWRWQSSRWTDLRRANIFSFIVYCILFLGVLPCMLMLLPSFVTTRLN